MKQRVDLARLATVYFVVLGIAALANLITLVYARTEEQRSTTWRYSDPGSTAGQFTHESWSCQLGARFASDDVYFERLAETCTDAVSPLMP